MNSRTRNTSSDWSKKQPKKSSSVYILKNGAVSECSSVGVSFWGSDINEYVRSSGRGSRATHIFFSYQATEKDTGDGFGTDTMKTTYDF